MAYSHHIGFKRTLLFRAWDALCIIGLFLAWDYWHYTGLTSPHISNVLFALGSYLLISLGLNACRCYDRLQIHSISQALLKIGSVWLLFTALLFSTLYLLKLNEQFPRLVIGPWICSAFICMFIPRMLSYWLMHIRYQRGIGLQETILIGNSSDCLELAQHFQIHPEFAITIKTWFSTHDDEVQALDGLNYGGNISALSDWIQSHDIQRVIIAAEFSQLDLVLEPVLEQLAETPIIVQFAANISHYFPIGIKTDNYAGKAIFNITGCPLSSSDILLKWLEDKTLSILIIILISPILLLIALLIKCTSRGPVLFIQQRHGIYGQAISVLKFRTMHAEQLTHSKDSIFKQAQIDDPRITKFGSFLRRFSLDELPQFFNVLFGSMSIVGPRPHALEHNKQFTKTVDGLMRRHYMKPGITGLAQINGARGITTNNEDMELRLRYDLEYIRNWSLGLDLKIILLTLIKGFYNRQP